MTTKFRSKVTEIEAEQFTDPEIPPKGVYTRDYKLPDKPKGRDWYVITIHGQHTPVVLGDWILPEPDGEHFYPCKPEVFAAKYQPADGQTVQECIRRWIDTGNRPGALEQGESERGFYNGLEASLAIIEDREPNFRTREELIGRPHSFRSALQFLLNYHGMETRGRGGDTPDFILAELLAQSLATFDRAIEAREGWYGRTGLERQSAVVLRQMEVPLAVTGPGVEYDSARETKDHIALVRSYLHVAMQKLFQRGDSHDSSKLRPPEKAGFDAATPKLKTLVYGTAEYAQALADLAPTLDHHYAVNSHHPEHHIPECTGDARPRLLAAGTAIARMTLLDLLEMLCDWKAAGERHANGGDIWDSLRKNVERFGISPQLEGILAATINEFGWKSPRVK